MYLEKFDPLAAKGIQNEEVVFKALKREITNILSSYVGWFDPFCELIQNALDAVDERIELREDNYTPTIKIYINIKDNYIVVTDNGVGFDEEKYKKFLAPNFSFKNEKTRGHKGVGATYLAYGFNYMQIATKSPDFVALGSIKNARKWLTDENPVGNPMVEPDKEDCRDSYFNNIDRGVSICVEFDTYTTPRDLSWIQLKNAESWMKILRVKTGLGAIVENDAINVVLEVVDKTANLTTAEITGIKYLRINELIDKCGDYTQIKTKLKELHDNKGTDYRIPAKFSNLKAIHDVWTSEKIATEIKLNSEELAILDKYKPHLYFIYVYSLDVWKKINSSAGIRSNQNILHGGIQLGANNMPQGELIQIPLTKNTGRQKQAHFYIHFSNCVADLGRKGFQKEITDFAKELARKALDTALRKTTKCFKKNTGVELSLINEQNLDNWKDEMLSHENHSPLIIKNQNFFLPTNQISITSSPTREQDVIALFNQLLAGGVIRGVKIMGTNERTMYDSLYKISIFPPHENQIYNEQDNPLGVDEEKISSILENNPEGYLSKPRVLEYKYILDALIEDVSTGIKDSNAIDLVVVWDSGEAYKEEYFITSLLLDDNRELRQYHGITHFMHDSGTGERVCDLIILKDLIEYLNDPESCEKDQEKYDE